MVDPRLLEESEGSLLILGVGVGELPARRHEKDRHDDQKGTVESPILALRRRAAHCRKKGEQGAYVSEERAPVRVLLSLLEVAEDGLGGGSEAGLDLLLGEGEGLEAELR